MGRLDLTNELPCRRIKPSKLTRNLVCPCARLTLKLGTFFKSSDMQFVTSNMWVVFTILQVDSFANNINPPTSLKKIFKSLKHKITYNFFPVPTKTRISIYKYKRSKCCCKNYQRQREIIAVRTSLLDKLSLITEASVYQKQRKETLYFMEHIYFSSGLPRQLFAQS